MTDHPEGNSNHQDDLNFIQALRAALVTSIAAESISAAPLPDTLLESIVRAAARAIPCPEGALLVVDQERRILTFDVVIGQTADTVRDITVPLGHGIAGLVAASGQAMAISNARDDPRHARDIAELSGYLPTTILAVPVTGTDGEPIGVLELLDRQGQPTFSLADMELLGMFADQVAAVLEMRRVHDALGARIGAVIATLTGLPPEAHQQITERAGAFASRVEATDDAHQTSELATLVASVASRGPAEYEACKAVLIAFADYLESTPTLGMGMFR